MDTPIGPTSPDNNARSGAPQSSQAKPASTPKGFTIGNTTNMIDSPGFQAFFKKLNLKNPDQQKKFVLTLVMTANTTIKIAMNHLIRHLRELRHKND